MVLNGQLVEHEEPVADVHLSNLDVDSGELHSLADVEPKITRELKLLAEDWRDNIEERWTNEFSSTDYEYVSHGMV